jgi:hypothetical protein
MPATCSKVGRFTNMMNSTASVQMVYIVVQQAARPRLVRDSPAVQVPLNWPQD